MVILLGYIQIIILIIIFKMDKLVCVLCRKAYKQPKMCSSCSQIYCQKCIEPYLAKHHTCPSCNQVLPEFADCTRLIAQLKQHVKYSPSHKFKRCQTHDLPLKYECIDCALPICSDCGVIQQKHRGHRLQPRGEVNRDFQKGKLREYLLSVQQYILKDHNRSQQLILEREVLRSQLRWCKNRLRQYYQEMNAKLEQEANRLMREITDDLEQKEERLSSLKKIKEDINEFLQIKDFNDEEAIERISPNNKFFQQQFLNQEQMFQKLQRTLDDYKEMALFNFNRKSLNTLNEVFPEYINNTYEFDYDTHQYSNVEYSNSFHIYGQEWKLKIYPKGNGQSPNHLSLFLELINSPNPTIGSDNHVQQYYFRLQLISLNTAGKTISKQYRSPFVTGDCWGYNDFVALSQLPEYLNHGHLIFVVGVRNCSYFDISENMRRYIRKLEGEKKVLQELLSHSNMQSDFRPEQISLISSSRILSIQSSNIVDSD